MNISTETREILRNYKAVINARRREMGVLIHLKYEKNREDIGLFGI